MNTYFIQVTENEADFPCIGTISFRGKGEFNSKLRRALCQHFDADVTLDGVDPDEVLQTYGIECPISIDAGHGSYKGNIQLCQTWLY